MWPQDELDLDEIYDLDSVYDKTTPSFTSTAQEKQKEKPWWEKAYQDLVNPLSGDKFRQLAKAHVDLIPSLSDRVSNSRIADQYPNFTKTLATTEGLGRGLFEGLGSATDELTAPVDIAGFALGAGGYKAGLKGANNLRKIFSAGEALTGAPQMAHGGYQFLTDDTPEGQIRALMDIAGGSTQTAGGIANWSGFGPKPVPKTDVKLPDNFGPAAYAGPERRNLDSRPKAQAADVAFQEYRDRFARGEDVRSPASKELFQAKQNLDNFRENKSNELPEYDPSDLDIGDIVVDKTGVEHEFKGLDARGKEIWKIARKENVELDLDSLYEEPTGDDPNAVSSMAKPPEFAFNDTVNFDEPEPFFHLEDGSTVSRRELERRGIPLEVVDEPSSVNASGESMASGEAISRSRGMKDRGEKFVVYDRAGNRRELIGPEAVDYNPYKGETYGIEDNQGNFHVRTHNGGKPPAMRPIGEQLWDNQLAIDDVRNTPDVYDLGDITPQKAEYSGFGPKSNLGKRGVADFTPKESPVKDINKMDFQFGDIVRHPGYGIGRISANAQELQRMTVQELDNYRSKLVRNVPNQHADALLEGDRKALAAIDAEFVRRREQGYGSVTEGDFEGPSYAKGESEDTIGMGLGGLQTDPTQIMRAYLNTYAEAGGRVATKELIQNAIDAAQDTGGRVRVRTSFDKKTVNVHDEGSGLTREMIENVYTNLTESGKRGGPTKKIGEMGVGKSTYLLGSEKFKVITVAQEPDGRKMMYEFEGTPEDMYNRTVKLKSSPVPQDTGTFTDVTIWNKDKKAMESSHQFLQQFKRFSNSPVEVDINSYQYPSFSEKDYPDLHKQYNIDETIAPRDFGGGKMIAEGETVGGKYRLSIPPDTKWEERNGIALILMNRGMFQGIDAINYVKGELPEAILVEVDPTVDGLNREYPLTAPTRERLKDSFKQPLVDIIKKELIEKAEAARQQRIQDAYDSLQPIPGKGFALLDSGGRYTPEELKAFVDSPVTKVLGDQMANILTELDRLHPSQQLGKTSKYGFYLTDDNNGGINIPNPASPAGGREYAILVNPFSILQYPPEQAAQRLVHIIMHEFTHNKARNEGAGFTWALAETYTKYALEKQLNAANQIVQAFGGKTASYGPAVSRLLQKHIEVRKRADVTKDLLSEQRASEFIGQPEQTGIARDVELSRAQAPAGNNGGSGSGNGPKNYQGYINGQPQITVKPTGGKTTPPPSPQQTQQAMAKLYQLQTAHKMAPPGPVKQSLYGKIRDFNRTLLTSLDLSAAGRQGLPLIAEKEYWTSLDDMFKSAGSQAFYDDLRNMVDSSPLAQPTYMPVMRNGKPVRSRVTGNVKIKKMPSFYDQVGLDLTTHEETTGSKLAEMIPGVKASSRAYQGFLTKLRFDTFNRMMQDLANTGVNIQQDIAKGKQLAEFINNSTGRGSLGKMEKHAWVLNEAFFAPRLMAAKLRRYAQIFQPSFYMKTEPQVRNAALKSIISTAAFGIMAGELMKMAGATVNNDPTNSDFRKIRFGNTRLDPFGGDQQYIVAAARMLTGNHTSPATNRTTRPKDVNEYFVNMGKTVGEFGMNKVSPAVGFAAQILTGKNRAGGKLNIPDAAVESTVPLLLQDLEKIYQEDPGLLPLGILPFLGVGVQTFGNR